MSYEDISNTKPLSLSKFRMGADLSGKDKTNKFKKVLRGWWFVRLFRWLFRW